MTRIFVPAKERDDSRPLNRHDFQHGSHLPRAPVAPHPTRSCSFEDAAGCQGWIVALSHAGASVRQYPPRPGRTLTARGVGHGRGTVYPFRRAVKFFLTQSARIRSRNLGLFQRIVSNQSSPKSRRMTRSRSAKKNAKPQAENS